MTEQLFARSPEIRAAHPLFNENKLKLGVFGINWSGVAFVQSPARLVPRWKDSLEVARLADGMGFEAIVPVSRWVGLVPGKPRDASAQNLESFTWASAVCVSTRQAGVFATCPIHAYHPMLAAKQAATIDQISGGRFGLNIVAGWNPTEAGLFGHTILDHDARYRRASEWVEIVQKVWTSEEEFDHEGEFWTIHDAYTVPLPAQEPGPPIMNAGGSGQGRDFAARHADMAFVSLRTDELEEAAAMVDDYRTYAREHYGRELGVWSHGYVVHSETDEEAQRKADELYANGDFEAVDAMMAGLVKTHSAGVDDENFQTVRRNIVLGSSGFPLIGSTETIADRLQFLSRAGIDGVLVTWLDYPNGLRHFRQEILPILEERGLRAPYDAGDGA
jgi:alkanesulfonate monooxygenase SsuD/methylene tetrahydromethanopterin reductase-like flavin-dependent oxidoreductase (luciferase family)